MTLGMEVGLSPGDFVLDGYPAPPQKGGGAPPQFSVHPFLSFLLWPNGWMHQDATWYGGRPQPMGVCVIWGPSTPLQKGGRAPQFSAYVYCGQMAGWIKMALGMEVSLGPGHIVLDGDPAPPSPKRRQSPQF